MTLWRRIPIRCTSNVSFSVHARTAHTAIFVSYARAGAVVLLGRRRARQRHHERTVFVFSSSSSVRRDRCGCSSIRRRQVVAARARVMIVRALSSSSHRCSRHSRIESLERNFESEKNERAALRARSLARRRGVLASSERSSAGEREWLAMSASYSWSC